MHVKGIQICLQVIEMRNTSHTRSSGKESEIVITASLGILVCKANLHYRQDRMKLLRTCKTCTMAIDGVEEPKVSEMYTHLIRIVVFFFLNLVSSIVPFIQKLHSSYRRLPIPMVPACLLDVLCVKVVLSSINHPSILFVGACS